MTHEIAKVTQWNALPFRNFSNKHPRVLLNFLAFRCSPQKRATLILKYGKLVVSNYETLFFNITFLKKCIFNNENESQNKKTPSKTKILKNI